MNPRRIGHSRPERWRKWTERRLISVLTTPEGCILGLFLVVFGVNLFIYVLFGPCAFSAILDATGAATLAPWWSARALCPRSGHRDNIGHVDVSRRTSYGPIDVVYTWVNGSDPVWQSKKAYWKAIDAGEPPPVGSSPDGSKRRRVKRSPAKSFTENFSRQAVNDTKSSASISNSIAEVQRRRLMDEYHGGSEFDGYRSVDDYEGRPGGPEHDYEPHDNDDYHIPTGYRRTRGDYAAQVDSESAEYQPPDNDSFRDDYYPMDDVAGAEYRRRADYYANHGEYPSTVDDYGRYGSEDYYYDRQRHPEDDAWKANYGGPDGIDHHGGILSDSEVQASAFGNSTTANHSASGSEGPATAAVDAAQTATTTEEAKEEDEDNRDTDNRYRDSNELLYSLRSLEKYAPWIRHVYLVTDNQVPNWLDTSNPRITVVPHEDIFPNKSHLPVFSSPSIEAHLHRIPGLSERFAYFNDDVFLGAPTWPEDFIALDGAQKVYLSWDVPKCNDGCSDTWLGDGYCDKNCNVSKCGFDYGDCEGKHPGSDMGSRRSRNRKGGASKGGGGDSNSGWTPPKSLTTCAKACPDNWLADKVCDAQCDTLSCAFDGGDCGLTRVWASFPGAVLPSPPPSSMAPESAPSSVASEEVDHWTVASHTALNDGAIAHSFHHSRDENHSNSTNKRGVLAFWSLRAEEPLAEFQTLGCPTNDPKCHSKLNSTVDNIALEALLRVPYGTDAVYVNLSLAFPIEDYMFDDATFDTYVAPPPLTGATNTSANITSTLDSSNTTAAGGAMPSESSQIAAVDSSQQPELEVVQNAVLLKQHAVLVLVLHTQAQDNPPAPPSKAQLPASVVVTLQATATANGAASRAVRFRIEVTDKQTNIQDSSNRCGVGSQINCSDGLGAYNNTHSGNIHDSDALSNDARASTKTKKDVKSAVADDDAATWLGRWQPWHRHINGYATSCLPAAALRTQVGAIDEAQYGASAEGSGSRNTSWSADSVGNSSTNTSSSFSRSSNSSNSSNSNTSATISPALMARLGPPLSQRIKSSSASRTSNAMRREDAGGRLADNGGLKLIYDGRVDKQGMGGLFLLPQQHTIQNNRLNSSDGNSSSNLFDVTDPWSVDSRAWQTGRLTVSQSGGFNGAKKRQPSSSDLVTTTAAHAFPMPRRAYTHFASSSSSTIGSSSNKLTPPSEYRRAWGVTPKGMKTDKTNQVTSVLAAMFDRSTNHTEDVGDEAAVTWAMRLALPEPKRSGPPRQEATTKQHQQDYGSSRSTSANSQWYLGRVQVDLEPPLGEATTSEAACIAAGFTWKEAQKSSSTAAAAPSNCMSGRGCKKGVTGQCLSHPLACAQVIVEWPPLPHSNEWLENREQSGSDSGHLDQPQHHYRRRRLLAIDEASPQVAEPVLTSAILSQSPASTALAFVSRQSIRMTSEDIAEEGVGQKVKGEDDENSAIVTGKHRNEHGRRSLLRKGHIPQQAAKPSTSAAVAGLDNSRSQSETEKSGSGYWGLPARLVPSALAVGEAAEEILLGRDHERRSRGSSRSSGRYNGSTTGGPDEAWVIQRASWWARMAGGLADLQSGRHTASSVRYNENKEMAWHGASRGGNNDDDGHDGGGGGGGASPRSRRSGRGGGRRSLLMDTFGDSLIFVNQLYNAQFGTPDAMRKVPAHMPHFIDTTVMKQLQATFPDQWDATSTHRFRSPTDMQYGFSYFYFLQNQASARDLDWESLWDKELDVDGSGFLDENELLTLTSMAKGKEPDGHDVENMRNCMTNGAVAAVEQSSAQEEHARAAFAAAWRYDGSGGDSSDLNSRLWRWLAKLDAAADEGLRRADKARRRWLGWDAPLVDPTSSDLLLGIEALVRCDVAVDGLRDHARKPPTFEKITHLSEVAFEMIGDDFNRTIDQLNSIRARKTKFVCVNDDMQQPTPEMVEFLQAFYRSFFPHPSQFELPPGSARNPPGVGPKGLAFRRWVKRCLFTLIVLAALAASFYWVVMYTNPSDEDDDNDEPAINGPPMNAATATVVYGSSGRRTQKKD